MRRTTHATESDKLYNACDPEKENLCLYGHPDGSWEVGLPAEEVSRTTWKEKEETKTTGTARPRKRWKEHDGTEKKTTDAWKCDAGPA